VLIWQDGYGSHAIWGIPATGVVTTSCRAGLRLPVWGVDGLRIFIVARVKEAHDAGRSTDEAIVEGLGHTGRLVTSAAIILFLAFAALASGLKCDQSGSTGMGVGILLDATVVRALLVPALVSLLGRRNCGCPSLTAPRPRN